MTVLLKAFDGKRIRGSISHLLSLGLKLTDSAIIAGFFTGGSLAVRGGVRSMRNSAIGCACLLAVFEGVGISMQRAMAPPPIVLFPFLQLRLSANRLLQAPEYPPAPAPAPSPA